MRRISCVNAFAMTCVGLGLTGCASLCPLDRFDIASASLQSGDPVSDDLIGKCREALLAATRPYGAVQVAISGGVVWPGHKGATASILVTAVYPHADGAETRQAVIDCQLNDKGVVVGLKAVR